MLTGREKFNKISHNASIISQYADEDEQFTILKSRNKFDQSEIIQVRFSIYTIPQTNLMDILVTSMMNLLKITCC